ncbi:MAG: hypothetical protein FIB06_01570 [Betaproteobacteria bacterium]|nr:hypothetical protein [Betaproteobacteria bacterium]
MRIAVEVKGLDAMMARLQGKQKQINFAASQALNKTAREIEKAQRDKIGGTFDRPKPATAKATYVVRSTKTNLEARIGIKNRTAGIPAAEYLAPNIGKSGSRPRSYKRSEMMLRSAGILPAGMYTVPGKEAKLDAFGNMSRGQIVQILGYFRTFGTTRLNSARMNMSDKRRQGMAKRNADYFIVPISDRKLKLYPGIWQRTSSNTLAPVLMFVSRPVYKAIYDFEGTAERLANKIFYQEFKASLSYALSTAR